MKTGTQVRNIARMIWSGETTVDMLLQKKAPQGQMLHAPYLSDFISAQIPETRWLEQIHVFKYQTIQDLLVMLCGVIIATNSIQMLNRINIRHMSLLMGLKAQL